jgi:hypothetical protein
MLMEMPGVGAEAVEEVLVVGMMTVVVVVCHMNKYHYCSRNHFSGP